MSEMEVIDFYGDVHSMKWMSKKWCAFDSRLEVKFVRYKEFVYDDVIGYVSNSIEDPSFV